MDRCLILYLTPWDRRAPNKTSLGMHRYTKPGKTGRTDPLKSLTSSLPFLYATVYSSPHRSLHTLYSLLSLPFLYAATYSSPRRSLHTLYSLLSLPIPHSRPCSDQRLFHLLHIYNIPIFVEGNAALPQNCYIALYTHTRACLCIGSIMAHIV